MDSGRKQVIKSKWFRASTLIETMVAMVLITTSFGIGMIVYINVVKAESLVKAEAEIALNQVAYSIKVGKKIEFDDGKFVIRQLTKPYQEGLKILLLEAATKDGKIICRRKEIIPL